MKNICGFIFVFMTWEDGRSASFNFTLQLMMASLQLGYVTIVSSSTILLALFK